MSANPRLSEISTRWSIVRQAHAEADQHVASAHLAIYERYHLAIYRYFLGATRDQDVASDLLQDFARRLCEGRFRSAEPAKGRFRDFLRTALIHMVADHRRASARAVAELKVDPASWDVRQLDALMSRSVRQEVLSKTWEALRELQGASAAYTVLRTKAENPTASSEQLAELLRAREGFSQFTAVSARKALQRAREQFAGLLIEELARCVGSTDLDEIETEAIDLELHAFCRKELERRRVN